VQQKELFIPNHPGSFWSKAIETSIIALVILIPIVFYPRCITVFLPAKELIAEILVLLALMFWGFRMINRDEIKLIFTPLNFPILSFVSICLLSLIWSNSFFVSLKELSLFLTGPLLYFVLTNNISEKQQINRILNTILIVGGLFGIYGILQYNGIDFAFWAGNIGRQQVFGLFGNVNYFAVSGSLILTFTRGSYLAVGISSFFMFSLYLARQGKGFIKEHKKIFIFILALIVLVTFLFAIPNPLNKPGTVISKIKSRISISQFAKGSSLKRREAIWKFTSLMIKDHPLLGSGIGTYKYNSLSYQAKFFEQAESRSIYPHGFADKAHNEYLQLWAELGIVGLGIFIWLMVSYFSYGIKLLRKIKDSYKRGIIIGLMGSIMAVLVDGIFGFPLHLPATIVLFWLVLALTIATIKIEADGGKNYIIKKNLNPISRFKSLLYIFIILLTVFLCITVTRPFIARTYLYYANKEIKDENWNKAIKMDEEALKWDPYLGEAYYDIGKILEIKGIYNSSLEYFMKASKYIDHIALPQDIALIYLKKGQLDKAVMKLKQAISYQRDEKSMVSLYSELGNTYLRVKRYKPAEIAFKNSLKINPDFINAHYGLAGAYLNQNKIEEALVELQKVIELAPDSQEANYAQNIIQQITQEKLKTQPTETSNP